MTSWGGYPSIYALGHRYLADLLLDPVLVEEKIDGSQFSFGLFEDGYKARSRGAAIEIDAPDSMFKRAIEVIKILPLHAGWTYRAEYLQKPKHNTLAYDRIPKQHLILFDVNVGEEDYLPYEAKRVEADRLGLEVVPVLYEGIISDVHAVKAFLDTPSVLGGQKIEGVVVKNYLRFGLDKKALMGKFVSESFKEQHKREWKVGNPAAGDIIQRLIEGFRSEARWAKGVQHLRETGIIQDAPQDIQPLFKAIPEDILAECADDIKETLFKWAWPKIQRGAMAGFAEWYKNQLLERQFTP